MAVDLDLREWKGIQPLNKEDLGNRLSLFARNKAYGENKNNSSSPAPLNAEFKSNKILATLKCK